MERLKNNNILLSIITLFALYAHLCSAQNQAFKKKSLKTGIGVGYNEGETENGMGIIYSIGLQKTVGKKQRTRLNPNLMIGGFTPIGFTDARQQFYRTTTLGYNLHYDVLKYKTLSIVTSVGPFVTYSRGLLGTSGDGDINNRSEYFTKLYYGGSFSVGLRIDAPKKNVAYEIRLLNVMVGNNYFGQGYFMFGVDFKSKK